MTQRTRTRGRDGTSRGRSWQVPLSVAVIVISLIAIWRLSGGLFDDDDGLVDLPSEPDPEITAFWLESGSDLLTDWYATSPLIVQDIALGRDCLQSEEFKPVGCPDLPARFQGYRVALEALMARAEALERPPDSTADEWLTSLISAWAELEESLGVYAQLALAGYQDEPWLEHQERYREDVIPRLTDAEFARARMLAEVESDVRGSSSN